MKGLAAIFIIALAIMLGGALASPIQERWEDSNAYHRQVEAIQLEREQTTLADWQAQQQATAASRAIVGNMGWLGAGALLVIIVGYIGVQAQRRSDPLIKFAGEWVPRRLIEDGRLIQILEQRIMADAVARIEQARNVGVPHVFSPHYSSRGTNLALPEPPAQLTAASVPSFGDLLNAGRIGRNNPLLLGFDAETATPIEGTWKDLYSSAIAGVSGSGKTTTVRFLAAQSAFHAARWVLLDPHADAGDDSLAGTLQPLSSTFLCAPAVQPRAMLESVRLVTEELDRRLASRSADRFPLVIAADEFTSLMRGDLAEPLAALIERIAQEGRKVLVFALVSGQVWTAERTGGSALRDSLASCYVHRMKRRQANHLLQLGDELPETLNLQTGHALLYRTTGELIEVTIPNTTAGDISRVASLLASNRHMDMPTIGQNEAYSMPGDMPTVSQMSANGTLAYSAPVRAEAKRAAQMFMEGADPAAIVLALRNVRTNEGKRYQTALADVLNLVREGMRGAV
jgi:hypothetical protein